MGARTTSVLKDLEHRSACVGLAGNNLELAGNEKPELRQQQYTLDLADKSRRQNAPRAHNLMEVSPQTILDVGPTLSPFTRLYHQHRQTK